MQKILLVDDDEVFREAAKNFLTDAGYAVAAVEDSLFALMELESVRPIDLVVVDVMMPRGFPNAVALAAMADLSRMRLPILFVTGHAELMEKRREGMILVKPFPLENLLQAIRNKLPMKIGPASNGGASCLRGSLKDQQQR